MVSPRRCLGQNSFTDWKGNQGRSTPSPVFTLNLGSAYTMLQRPADAEAMFRRSLALAESRLGGQPPLTAGILRNAPQRSWTTIPPPCALVTPST